MVKEGGFSNHFYAIEEGTVKVERGGEHLADLGPGDVFGEQGLLERQERSASVVCHLAAQGDQDRALGAVPDAQVDAPGGGEAPAQRSRSARASQGRGRRLDWRRHTAGGQGKSGANPARSRHCDRAPRAARLPLGGQPLGTPQRPREGAARIPEARRPVRRPAVSTLEERMARCSYLYSGSARCRASVASCSCSRARLPRPPHRAPTFESSPPRGKTLAEFRQYTGTVDIRTDRGANCFGQGTGGSGERVKVTGPTALGAVRDAPGDRYRPAPAVGHRRLLGRRFRPRGLRHRRLQVPGLELLVREARPRRGPGLRQPAPREPGRRHPLVPVAELPAAP